MSGGAYSIAFLLWEINRQVMNSLFLILVSGYGIGALAALLGFRQASKRVLVAAGATVGAAAGLALGMVVIHSTVPFAARVRGVHFHRAGDTTRTVTGAGQVISYTPIITLPSAQTNYDDYLYRDDLGLRGGRARRSAHRKGSARTRRGRAGRLLRIGRRTGAGYERNRFGAVIHAGLRAGNAGRRFDGASGRAERLLPHHHRAARAGGGRIWLWVFGLLREALFTADARRDAQRAAALAELAGGRRQRA